ncbi:hypothetical protein BB559_007357 [Furculomyces boomerangus]|uniref:Multiple myeloma tumor-associated protein 2-like N-terminal domain-containing protein n=2 Tax=Harpellales TaxID=61421 RepID=A0A2T9XXN0_9FUNG|nr:hypothetical protein BB559_007357 [Furculomyces boomerangus]PVZ97090.1 hypothetical protein BB558_006965 [Smittium angustum]PVZ99813.1 hypothetical protein BB558_004145 [Smittium angustum]
MNKDTKDKKFSWEKVKEDKFRETFLGNSAMAPAGRWQKGIDLFWYTKNKKGSEASNIQRDELAALKEKEAEAMAEALGLPKHKTKYRDTPTTQDIRKVTEQVVENDLQSSGIGYKENYKNNTLESSFVESGTVGIPQTTIEKTRPTTEDTKKVSSSDKKKESGHSKRKKHRDRSRDHKKEKRRKSSRDRSRDRRKNGDYKAEKHERKRNRD